MTLQPATVPVGNGESWRERVRYFCIGRSLADCVEQERDNILHLRLIAALLVVLGHSSLGGGSAARYDFVNWVFPQAFAHHVGLMMFFVISGFLITLSFLRRPDLVRFLRARFLRLWPALVACQLMWAFVLGPIISDLPLRAYFAPGAPDNPYSYAWAAASIFRMQHFLPGVFTTNPSPRWVNAQLWTIPIEATMYLWVAGAGALRLLKFPWLTSIGIAGIFSVLVLWPMTQGTLNYYVPGQGLETIIKGFFGAGAIACLLRRHVPISSGIMLMLAAVSLLATHTSHAMPVIWLTVCYFVFWFAYIPRLPAVPHELDLSYGVYLWAWPVQQTVVHMGVHDPIVNFAITAPTVLAIATASWLLVEKPALRLKDLRWLRARAAQTA